MSNHSPFSMRVGCDESGHEDLLGVSMDQLIFVVVFDGDIAKFYIFPFDCSYYY